MWVLRVLDFLLVLMRAAGRDDFIRLSNGWLMVFPRSWSRAFAWSRDAGPLTCGDGAFFFSLSLPWCGMMTVLCDEGKRRCGVCFGGA